MTLLHTMSLAGSIAVGMYLLLYPITKRYFSMLWHKIYLTITTLLFITPFQYISADYRLWLNKILTGRFFHQSQENLIDVSKRTVFIYDGAVYFSNLWIYIAMAPCLLLSIWLLVQMLRRYRGVRFGIMEGTCRDKEAEAVLHSFGDGLRTNEKVPVYRGKYLQTPVTVGILKQKIILPDIEWSKENLRNVFLHELVHIRVYDNFAKLIVLLALILNFYNPAVYYLCYRWNLVAEMYCDDKVITGKSGQEMSDYANVIISLAEERKSESESLPIVGLSNAKRTLKKRIERIGMMKQTGKKYGKISRVVGSIVTLAAVFVSSLTVLAYEPEQTNDIHRDKTYSGEEIEFFFSAEEAVDSSISSMDVLLKEYEEHIVEDISTLFVNETGAVYPATDGQPYMLCSHNYVNGTFIMHSKYPNGSCDVEYYHGQRCEKCGHCIYGEHISTTTYDVCPH